MSCKGREAMNVKLGIQIIKCLLLAFAAGVLIGLIHPEAAAFDQAVAMMHAEAVISDAPPEWDPAISYDEDRPYGSIVMSEQEAHELEIILALEAQSEGLTGEMAVAEVIFNRVLSPNWPNTIHEVLSQRGQFATWKYLDRPYNTPGEMESDAIAEVLAETKRILPDGRYVYFDSVGGANGRQKIRIGRHTFGRESK